MPDNKKIAEQWADYRPTKSTWIWSCVGAAALTMIVGFTVGGWTTSGTVEEMVAEAEYDARAQLASTICVERFVSAPDASSRLAELKDTPSYQQDDFVEEGGWTTLAGMDEAVDGASDLCASTLAAMDGLPAAADNADAATAADT